MYITAKSGEEVVKLLEAALDHYTKEKQDLLLKVDSNISKPKSYWISLRNLTTL